MFIAYALGVVIAAAPAGAAPAATSPQDRMAQGKLDADLGNHDAAAKAFAQVAEASGAPPSMQAEAWIRLAAAKRALGDYEGAIPAVDRAFKLIVENADPTALAQLVISLGYGVPGDDRWAQIWSQVAFPVDRSDKARPIHRIEWPGIPRRAPGHVFGGHPIQLHFVNGNLQDIFRLFADITGLNVVVHPGVEGSINLRFKDVPWDDALERILWPNGLLPRLEGKVLRIARPEHIGTARKGAGAGATTAYTGTPIDVDLKNAELRAAIQSILVAGPASPLKLATGDLQNRRVTIKLNDVPWDQVLDVMVQTNALEWERKGDALIVTRPGEGSSTPFASGPPPADMGVFPLALQGTVRASNGRVLALLGVSDGRTWPVSQGTPLQNGAVGAIDATSVRFVLHDGREVLKTLYP
jgi:hypothetical protein